MLRFKYIKLLIVIIFSYCLQTNAYACSETNYNIYINNSLFQSDYSTILKEDKIYIPIRDFFESINGKVNWYSDTNEVEVIYNFDNLKFGIGNSQISLNGNIINIDSFSFLLNNKTYVNTQKLCELFSLDYAQLNFSKKIYIGVKKNIISLDYTIEYFVYDFPSPVMPTSYSITVNMDGSCILSYGKDFPIITIYPNEDTLNDIVENIAEEKKNYNFIKSSADNDKYQTDTKTIVLRITNNTSSEEYYLGDKIPFLESLFNTSGVKGTVRDHCTSPMS